MCIMTIMVILIALSLSSFNNIVLAYNSHLYYSNILNKNFDAISDTESFLIWQ